MRKEVKLGLAIGLVFLLVLVAYVLVAPETNRVVELTESGEPAPVSVDTTSDSALSSPAESAGQPGVDPFAADPAPQPQAREPRSLTDSNSPWAGLVPMDDAPPLMTTTPDPRQPAEAPQPVAEAAPAPVVIPPPAAPVSQPSGPLVSELTNSPPQPAPLVTAAPASVEPSPSTRPVAGQRIHTIQRGETLSSISAAAYGSANYYPHILRANPGLDAERLQVGSKIVLPDASEVRPDRSSLPRRQVRAATDPTSEYRVVSGDSLYRISMKLYGAPNRIDDLYELNKETIGPDPARLRADMVLRLPEPPTATASSR